MVSVHNAPKPVDGSKFPCGVCNKGVGINSIKCHACGFWVHKRCSNIKGPLKPDTDFKCKKCRGAVSNASIPDSVVINGEEIEKVSSFCYLGDFVGQCGGCFDATTARIRSAWKTFRDLLPILTCRGLLRVVVMPTVHVCVVFCCTPVKRGPQHRKMSLVLIAMI